jgi:Ser/Thr protein kinase RdoA (MazF antagonist)
MPKFGVILDGYPALSDPIGAPHRPAESLEVARLSGGLINDTFSLGESYVLQRLHPIFAAEVNLDIAAIVPRLRRAGVPVPDIVLARDGRPWVAVSSDQPEVAGVWRILTRIPGETLHRLTAASQARSAGRLVGQFHGALRDEDHTFAFTRPGAHDTPRHMAVLREALASHPGHRLAAQVATVANELLERWAHHGGLPTLPKRLVHGDLKASNLLFDSMGEAVGILDLDTMAHGTLDVELGDALRSWANPTTEDDPQPRLDTDLFLAAVEGYLDTTQEWITPAELQSLSGGLECICLELSARFAADALNERYFGWDPLKATGRGEHNLIRARNQLALARSVAAARPRLDADLQGLSVRARG